MVCVRGKRDRDCGVEKQAGRQASNQLVLDWINSRGERAEKARLMKERTGGCRSGDDKMG